jgi:hypothetical protein
LFFCFTLSGQIFFSVKPDYLKVKEEGHNLFSTYRSTYPDTGITALHDYHPRNFMGNVGLPSPRYTLRYGTSDLGFRFFHPPYDQDRFSEADVQYARTLGPYASLTGITGSKKLQMFRALFTQTYRNKINVNLSFRRYTSEGFYRRQQTYTNNFFLSSNYHEPGKRFGYYFFALNNGNKNNENGGITDTTLNDSTVLLNKVLLGNRLSAADRDNRETKFMINPFLRLNRRADSASAMVTYLHLRAKYSGQLYRYVDNAVGADGFYRRAYLDTAFTNDSSRVRQLSNELSVALCHKEMASGISAGFRHEYNYLWQHYDSVFSNGIVVADVFSRWPGDSSHRELFFQASARYVAMGPNEGNYKVESGVELRDRNGRHGFFLRALSELRQPDHFYNNWVSNHFYWWNRGFIPQKTSHAQFGWNYGKLLSVSVLYQQVRNYLYTGEDGEPSQHTVGPVGNLSLGILFNKVFARHLGVLIDGVIQNTNAQALVRFPPYHIKSRLYYTTNLFRNRLQMQLGGQAELYGDFIPYRYMPATQAFYLGSADPANSYPYLDVFLSARIRPASFFFKVENLLQGYAGHNYFLLPAYYQPDRAFRMGLTWMFFD